MCLELAVDSVKGDMDVKTKEILTRADKFYSYIEMQEEPTEASVHNFDVVR
jgi:hypothetical protein